MSYGPNQMYPGATELDPNYPKDKFKDNNPSTTNNGTPLKAIKENQDLTLETAVMNDAGFEYSGLPDTPQDSQLFKAYKASLGNGANLLSNHNFLIQTPDDSQPLPSATPTSYPPGYQIFSGVFANETIGINNLTYIDDRVSFSGGDLYFSVPNTGGIERLTSNQLTASVADFDGKPRTRGVSFALVGDEYRVTVGVDALEDADAVLTPLSSVKLEQGSVATGHEVDYGIVATGSTTPRRLVDRFADVVNVKDFGAVGDGITDDTLAIQSAVDSGGKSIYFPTPSVEYILTTNIIISSSGLTLFGDKRARIKQTTDAGRVFRASGLSGITIKGLQVSGSALATGNTQSSSIYFDNCTDCHVYDNLFNEHSSSAVLYVDCDGCTISGNSFYNADNVVDPTDDNDFCNDITIWGESTRCLVSNNIMRSGCMTAITFQLVGGTAVTMSDNSAIGNIVEGCRRYGIVCYNNIETLPDRKLLNTLISNNQIKNIYGDTGDSGVYQFGAGIYILSSEGTTITGNHIENTNVFTNDILVPGAIAISGTTVATVTGNTIKDAKYHGIYTVNTSFYGEGSTLDGADGNVVITGNNITNTDGIGIRVRNQHNVNISSNAIHTTTGIAIDTSVSTLPTQYQISINNNQITDSATFGIFVSGCSYPVVNSNTIRRCLSTGLYVDAVNALVDGNSIFENRDGIDVRGTSSNTILSNNSVDSQTRYGIVGSSDYLDSGNVVRNSTDQDYSGQFKYLRDLDNTGTPSVNNAKVVATTGTTTITDLLDGVEGQVVMLKAQGNVTIQHSTTAINLSNNANFDMVNRSVLTVVNITNVWHETARSV